MFKLHAGPLCSKDSTDKEFKIFVGSVSMSVQLPFQSAPCTIINCVTSVQSTWRFFSTCHLQVIFLLDLLFPCRVANLPGAGVDSICCSVSLLIAISWDSASLSSVPEIECCTDLVKNHQCYCHLFMVNKVIPACHLPMFFLFHSSCQAQVFILLVVEFLCFSLASNWDSASL